MNKTGEKCQKSGYYRFVRHTDFSVGCHPTYEEGEIPLEAGETFPPIKSCKKGAYWEYARPRW